mmetsp:Transcript_91399/g.158183  ORF Transcript_91399/g.158183 Transcript_91399/m.158183 type:complete len:110 (-) Transcript_91399:86-415(-)
MSLALRPVRRLRSPSRTSHSTWTEIFRGMTNTTWAIIVLDACLGLCVACVLKLADAMVKQLASGWLAPLEPLVGHFVVGTPVTPNMVISTILAGAGSIIYRIDVDAWKS